jgi:peroxiredoxin
MKTTVWLLTIVAIFAFNHKLAAQADHYIIYGNIEGAEGVKFVLQSFSSGKIVEIDSAVVSNGKFIMSGGSVKYPESDYLFAPEKDTGVGFFLENSVITITGKLDSLANAKITGSKTQDDYAVYLISTKPISDKMTKLSNEYKAANEVLMEEMKAARKDFVKNNPKSFVSPLIVKGLTKDTKPEEIEEMINGLDPAVANSPVIIGIKNKIAVQIKVAVGKKAPDFVLNDVKGNPVSLSSKIGPRLLLIDFWAGWCAPCRKENPNVLKVYNEFNKQGFDIIGVSLDRTKDDWEKAIKDDRLPWTQVSDLNYTKSETAKLYNVESIPANFLLDEKGIIIAVNLRGEALYNIVKGRLVSGN